MAQNCKDLRGHLPTWRHRPGPPPVNFTLKPRIEPENHAGSGMAISESSLKRREGAMAKTKW